MFPHKEQSSSSNAATSHKPFFNYSKILGGLYSDQQTTPKKSIFDYQCLKGVCNESDNLPPLNSLFNLDIKKQISFGKGRNKGMKVTEYLMTKNGTRMVINSTDGKQNGIFKKTQTLTNPKIPENLIEFLLVKKLTDANSIAEFSIKKRNITLPFKSQDWNKPSHWQFLYNTLEPITSVFRQSMIYQCSLEKADSLCVVGAKYSFNEHITKAHRKIIKDMLNDVPTVKLLIEMTRDPNFPMDTYRRKQSVVRLQLIADACINKKKKNKKNKNKKREDNQNEKEVDDSDDEEDVEEVKNNADAQYQEVMRLIDELDVNQDRIKVRFSKNFAKMFKQQKWNQQ